MRAHVRLPRRRNSGPVQIATSARNHVPNRTMHLPCAAHKLFQRVAFSQQHCRPFFHKYNPLQMHFSLQHSPAAPAPCLPPAAPPGGAPAGPAAPAAP